MVHSLDGDTNFFSIITGVLPGNILEQYWFILCLDYVFWTSIDLIKENGFEFKKKTEADNIPQKL